MASAPAFNPLSLFASGEQGTWYDPSDLSTMYQDSVGTIPVTAVDQPVGLLLDKSKALALGSELVTNGGFSSDTAWTKGTGWTISGGKAVATAVSAFVAIDQSVSTVSGKQYWVTCDTTVTAGGAALYLGAAGDGAVEIVMTATGSYRKLITATATATLIIRARGPGFTGTIDNVSVKELPGNHAIQATSASRPMLRATDRLDFDGTDDKVTAAASGGGTTGFMFVAGINLDTIGANQTIWSDTGTNTGYRVRINSSNQLELSAGNGSAYTTVTTTETVSAATNYVIAVWHDGTNLNAKLGLGGTVAQVAFATATAGSASFTVGMDNGAVSSQLNGKVYNALYVKNFAGSVAVVNSTITYVNGKLA